MGEEDDDDGQQQKSSKRVSLLFELSEISQFKWTRRAFHSLNNGFKEREGCDKARKSKDMVKNY